jgi:hypothetical protein
VTREIIFAGAAIEPSGGPLRETLAAPVRSCRDSEGLLNVDAPPKSMACDCFSPDGAKVQSRFTNKEALRDERKHSCSHDSLCKFT